MNNLVFGKVAIAVFATAIALSTQTWETATAAKQKVGKTVAKKTKRRQVMAGSFAEMGFGFQL